LNNVCHTCVTPDSHCRHLSNSMCLERAFVTVGQVTEAEFLASD
jgi:hypothetical protein